MKAQKHHLVNWESGKTLCGIQFNKESIRIAEIEDTKWYNDLGDELDTLSNWKGIFCMTCLKRHELDLITQFNTQTFLVKYELNLPKSNRLRKVKKAKDKRNRIGKSNKPIQSPPVKSPTKSTNSIPKSNKGIARAKSKAQSKSIPTDNKCRIISKPAKKSIEESIDKSIDKSVEKSIEESIDKSIDEVRKPLIDLSNGPVTIEIVDPIDDWNIGDPIDDDIFELIVGDDWKLIRHNEDLDLWQFQTKSVIKGKPDWIADSEFISYKEASQFVIDGYCE